MGRARETDARGGRDFRTMSCAFFPCAGGDYKRFFEGMLCVDPVFANNIHALSDPRARTRNTRAGKSGVFFRLLYKGWNSGESETARCATSEISKTKSVEPSDDPEPPLLVEVTEIT